MQHIFENHMHVPILM